MMAVQGRKRPKSGSQRRFERRAVTRFIWYQTIDEPRVEGLGHSIDISRGGLGLITARLLPAETTILLQAVFDDGDPKPEKVNLVVTVVARVVFCRPAPQPGSYRLGLEFIAVPPDATRILSEYFY